MAFIQIVVSVFYPVWNSDTVRKVDFTCEVYEKVKKFLFSVGENAQKG